MKYDKITVSTTVVVQCLQKIKDLVASRSKYNPVDSGICILFKDFLAASIGMERWDIVTNVLEESYCTWEHYSGEVAYPIWDEEMFQNQEFVESLDIFLDYVNDGSVALYKEPLKGLQAEHMYDFTLNYFEGSYGKLRFDLLEHCIKHFSEREEKEINVLLVAQNKNSK
ncbi:hypothetical protein KNT64_gp198 [Pseudomonas phage PspYZU05]|uniref:Uncharacterized protein n=1 Tax=Pseudomonas phage PspYZU05 TaxID=1983556 RepID=A0A2U7N2M0_9CAUD|nr:hypothetical protein KNT64_gp198 [Pseudomonas phage PspYZU05]ASD52150.1 hypothetical protein PspYZU05_198 [Pseudomonas phage PspYZU05]